MAGKTTNLQLQKIDDTDYAGNFPTIYNNNLDLIDVLNNKQDKLIAGSGITIAADGKTISSSGKEYTAGDGIQISSDGVISVVMRNGTYNEPFFVSASITNGKTLSVRDINVSSFYSNIKVTRIGNTVTSQLSNINTSTNKKTYVTYANRDTECQIKINLAPILGKISRSNCVLDVLYRSNDSGIFYRKSTGDESFYSGTTGHFEYKPFQGVLVDGYLNVNVTIRGYGSSRYYGFPISDIQSGSYSTFTVCVGSISVSSN